MEEYNKYVSIEELNIFEPLLPKMNMLCICFDLMRKHGHNSYTFVICMNNQSPNSLILIGVILYCTYQLVNSSVIYSLRCVITFYLKIS